MQTHAYKGYEIPVDLMNLTGGGTDTFATISELHIKNLKRFTDLDATSRVVEIGCGIGRDAIPLTEIITSGRYWGVDVILPSILWCAQNISKRHRQFSFVHFDVKDQLHNPSGVDSMADIHLPVPDGGMDLIILQSVFTHMMAPDILHYLQEFARVLRPGGQVYATCFVITPAVLESARKTNLTPFDLTFRHTIDSGCFINDPIHPTGAVGYEPSALRDIVRKSGLAMDGDFLPGAWSGYYKEPVDGQDLMLLRKP